jgi:hypothetical protein
MGTISSRLVSDITCGKDRVPCKYDPEYISVDKQNSGNNLEDAAAGKKGKISFHAAGDVLCEQ